MFQPPLFLLALASFFKALPPLFADVVFSPVDEALWQAERHWPALLVIVLLIVTALLVRHFTKKK